MSLVERLPEIQKNEKVLVSVTHTKSVSKPLKFFDASSLSISASVLDFFVRGTSVLSYKYMYMYRGQLENQPYLHVCVHTHTHNT